MFKRFFLSGLCLLFSFLATTTIHAQAVSLSSLLDEMVDRDAVTRFPEPAYVCKQASSYDRRSVAPDQEHWFGNWDASQFVREEMNGDRKEWVLMDEQGPGAIVRWWITAPHYKVTFRIYLDGAEEPAVTAKIDDLVGGNALAGYPLSEVKAAGRNLFLPIPYAKSCKITVDQMDVQGNLYYQINFRTWPDGTPVETFSLDVLKKEKNRVAKVEKELQTQLTLKKRNMDSWTIAPGAVDNVMIQFDKPHKIAGMKIRLEAEDRVQALRSVVLRIKFDGKETVCCPLGDFFGSGIGVNPYKSWYTSVENDGTMVSRWQMPFKSQCEASLENLTDKPVKVFYASDVEPYDWNEQSMYFHCKWRQEREIQTKAGTGAKDWNYITIDGKGVFVGDSLTLLNRHPGWWGEGDEKIYVDGEKFPSHFGTGTEDYYGYAWCTPEFFESPFHAQPRAEGPQNYGNTTNSRYRLLDGIPFLKDFRFDMEIWHWHDTKVDYAVANYWYAIGDSKTNIPNDVTKEARNKVFYETEYVLTIPGYKLLNKPRGTVSEQTMDPFGKGWKNENRQIWWKGGEPGDELLLEITAAKSGKQKMIASFTKAGDYGIVQLWIDGKKVGEPIDLYDTKVVHSGDIDVGVIDLDAGPHELKVTIEGKNRKSGSYLFGIDHYEFRSVD